MLMYLKKDVIDFVEQFREYLKRETGRFQGPPYCPKEALQAIGGELIYVPGETLMGTDGKVTPIKPYKSKKFKVELMRATFPGRELFTIAHEIGHIMLHYKWPSDAEWIKRCEDFEKTGELSMYRKEYNRVEFEANLFAACFLMPEKEFKSMFLELAKEKGERGETECMIRPQTELEIANRFGVSKSAARTRSQFLGLQPW
nr:hypothetical protein 1 [bacterium]